MSKRPDPFAHGSVSGSRRAEVLVQVARRGDLPGDTGGPLRRRRASLGEARDCFDEDVRVNRLEQTGVEPRCVPDRRLVLQPRPADGDDRYPTRGDATDLLQEPHSIAGSSHTGIRNDGRGWCGLEQFEPLLGGRGGANDATFGAEEHRKDLAPVGVVVDDEKGHSIEARAAPVVVTAFNRHARGTRPVRRSSSAAHYAASLSSATIFCRKGLRIMGGRVSKTSPGIRTVCGASPFLRRCSSRVRMAHALGFHAAPAIPPST